MTEGMALSMVKYMQSAQSTISRRTFTTDEASKELGISKSTLLRWIREKRVSDVRRDRNQWRVFEVADIERIKKVL